MIINVMYFWIIFYYNIYRYNIYLCNSDRIDSIQLFTLIFEYYIVCEFITLNIKELFKLYIQFIIKHKLFIEIFIFENLFQK